MPHIVVEYTPALDIDVPQLLADLHEDFSKQETVDISQLKTRAIKLEQAIVADRGPQNLLHIMAIMLPGRSNELRHKMASDLHKIAHRYVPDENTSVTVETIELHGESYIK